MTRPLNTTTHAWAQMQRAARRRRVQEWLQSRPVVARVRRVRPGETDDCYAGWWELIPPATEGVPRPWQPGPQGGFLYRHHNVAVHWAQRMAETEAIPWTEGVAQ